jgi:hypothetical protein
MRLEIESRVRHLQRPDGIQSGDWITARTGRQTETSKKIPHRLLRVADWTEVMSDSRNKDPSNTIHKE